MNAPERITSASNPLLKELRLLARDATAYRRLGRVWLEGDHLCRAALQRGWRPAVAVVSDALDPEQAAAWLAPAQRRVVISADLFSAISGLPSPANLGWVLELAPEGRLDPLAPTVVLDRLQDAGNVGSILRSAAAFGFRQVLALRGTAALWSPKVLRAGMGAHFGLTLFDAIGADRVAELTLPLLATSSHRGRYLHEQPVPVPCAWLFGHEGQGISVALEQRANLVVRIAQPGGEESLNVAAAAAVCLHASAIART